MKKQFLQIPHDWFEKGLTPTELLLVSYIAGFDKNGCFTSQQKMAEMFNVSRATITRSLEKLEKGNFIVKAKKKNEQGFDSNLYISRLTLPKNGGSRQKSKNRFNNFEGREYTKEDFEELEKIYFN